MRPYRLTLPARSGPARGERSDKRGNGPTIDSRFGRLVPAQRQGHSVVRRERPRRGEEAMDAKGRGAERRQGRGGLLVSLPGGFALFAPSPLRVLVGELSGPDLALAGRSGGFRTEDGEGDHGGARRVEFSFRRCTCAARGSGLSTAHSGRSGQRGCPATLCGVAVLFAGPLSLRVKPGRLALSRFSPFRASLSDAGRRSTSVREERAPATAHASAGAGRRAMGGRAPGG